MSLIQRQLAALAALLGEADAEFGKGKDRDRVTAVLAANVVQQAGELVGEQALEQIKA